INAYVLTFFELIFFEVLCKLPDHIGACCNTIPLKIRHIIPQINLRSFTGFLVHHEKMSGSRLGAQHHPPGKPVPFFCPKNITGNMPMAQRKVNLPGDINKKYKGKYILIAVPWLKFG